MITRLLRVGRVARTGGGAQFTPGTLTGLHAFPIIELSRAAGMLWQDTGKTTLATIDTDPVAVIKCTFTGVEFTRITDDTHRAVLNVSGTKSWLTFTAASAHGYSFTGFSAAAASVHFGFQPSNVTGPCDGITGAINSFKLKLTDTTKMYGGKEGAANWTNRSTTVLVNGTDYTGGANYASTGDGRYFLNGADDGLGVADITTQLPTGNETRIGVSTSGTEPFGGRMYGWGLYSAKQTAANIASIHAFLRTYMP